MALDVSTGGTRASLLPQRVPHAQVPLQAVQYGRQPCPPTHGPSKYNWTRGSAQAVQALLYVAHWRVGPVSWGPRATLHPHTGVNT